MFILHYILIETSKLNINSIKTSGLVDCDKIKLRLL